MAQPLVRTPSIDDAIDETIGTGYVARDRSAIVDYLRSNLDLLPVLERVRERLGPPLVAPMPLQLDLAFDPEWEGDPPRLFVRIPTTLDAGPAIDVLDEISRAWWIDEFRQFGDRLGLILDYV